MQSFLKVGVERAMSSTTKETETGLSESTKLGASVFNQEKRNEQAGHV